MLKCSTTGFKSMSRPLLGSISVDSDAIDQQAIKSRDKEFKVNTLHLEVRSLSSPLVDVLKCALIKIFE